MMVTERWARGAEAGRAGVRVGAGAGWLSSGKLHTARWGSGLSPKRPESERKPWAAKAGGAEAALHCRVINHQTFKLGKKKKLNSFENPVILKTAS